MMKQTIIHSTYGILLGNEHEESGDTCSSLDGRHGIMLGGKKASSQSSHTV